MSPGPAARVRAALLLGLVALVFPSGIASAAQPEVRPSHIERTAWDERAAENGRLVVTFRVDASPSAARRLERASTRLVSFDRHDRRAIYRTSRSELRAELRRLQQDPSIRSVHVSHRLYRDVDPEDEQYWPVLWGLHNTGQKILGVAGEPNVDIDGREALAVSTGSGVVVAVIDDGVDFSQPDLAGQAWVNPGESGDGRETNGFDDDANGYVDDVNGWDFCHDDNTVHDVNDDFHGTHVAGTIGAKLDGEGVVGVAPGAKIMALKFLGDSQDVDGDPLCGWDDQAIEAIEYARSFGVRISNNSWGREPSIPPFGEPADDVPLYEAIRDSGMLFVAAAGNSGVNNDSSTVRGVPASFDLPNILSVAAIDNEGVLASFSNYGETTVDLAAPGVDIVSTFPAYDRYAAGHYYMSGTSMASPHVAGIAAIVASQTPSLLGNPTGLKSRILSTAKPDAYLAGLTLTGDIASAINALDTVPPAASAPNSYTFLTGQAIGSSIKTRVRWPAATDDLSGVASYRLGQSVNGGAWTIVRSSTTSRYADRSLTFSNTYRHRVRAFDRAGNSGAYVDGPQVRPRLRQQTSTAVTYGGTWRTRTSSSASGGSTRYATSAGAWVQFTFTGRAVAVVGPKGPTRGSVKVYVDDTYVATFSAYRSSSQSRIVLFARSWESSGSHRVKLVVVGTTGHPTFDIDAFAQLQ